MDNERVCWSCGVFANMAKVTDYFPLKKNPNAKTAVRKCANCGQFSIMITHSQRGRPATYLWVPPSPIGKDYPHVPKHIGGAADEAHRCHSIDAYRASVLLARSVVEATAKDKGITSGNLVDKIDAMEQQDLIRPIIKKAAHEIRHLGNDMAHGDFVNPVSEEESNETLGLMDMVLNEVYQEPALIEARQNARQAKKKAT